MKALYRLFFYIVQIVHFCSKLFSPKQKSLHACNEINHLTYSEKDLFKLVTLNTGEKISLFHLLAVKGKAETLIDAYLKIISKNPKLKLLILCHASSRGKKLFNFLGNNHISFFKKEMESLIYEPIDENRLIYLKNFWSNLIQVTPELTLSEISVYSVFEKVFQNIYEHLKVKPTFLIDLNQLRHSPYSCTNNNFIAIPLKAIIKLHEIFNSDTLDNAFSIKISDMNIYFENIILAWISHEMGHILNNNDE